MKNSAARVRSEDFTEVEQVSWLPPGGKIRYFVPDKLPRRDLITAVVGLVVHQGKLLIVRHRERGWDLPGGHVELDEALEIALKRELFEEAAVTVGDVKILAAAEITVTEQLPYYRYPAPKSYMIFFRCDLEQVHDFSAEFETEDRDFVPLEALDTLWPTGAHWALIQLAKKSLGAYESTSL